MSDEKDQQAMVVSEPTFAAFRDGFRSSTEIKALEQAEQLYPETVRLNKDTVGMMDGGILCQMESIETEFGETKLLLFERPDDGTMFTILFPKRIIERMEAARWGVGDVLAFHWKGYVAMKSKQAFKDIDIVRVGQATDKAAVIAKATRIPKHKKK